MTKSKCGLCGRNYNVPYGDSSIKCPSCNTTIRRIRIKQKLVELFGGKCKKCGNSYPAEVYEFHHKDPSKKEFGLAKGGTTSWEKIKKEAKKCDMLCSNCHKIEHIVIRSSEFLEALNNYQGRKLLI